MGDSVPNPHGPEGDRGRARWAPQPGPEPRIRPWQRGRAFCGDCVSHGLTQGRLSRHTQEPWDKHTWGPWDRHTWGPWSNHTWGPRDNAWAVTVGPGAARGQESLRVSGLAGDGVPSGLPPSLLEDAPLWQAPWAHRHPRSTPEAPGTARLVGTTGRARQRLPVGTARQERAAGLVCLVFRGPAQTLWLQITNTTRTPARAGDAEGGVLGSSGAGRLGVLSRGHVVRARAAGGPCRSACPP